MDINSMDSKTELTSQRLEAKYSNEGTVYKLCIFDNYSGMDFLEIEHDLSNSAFYFGGGVSDGILLSDPQQMFVRLPDRIICVYVGCSPYGVLELGRELAGEFIPDDINFVRSSLDKYMKQMGVEPSNNSEALLHFQDEEPNCVYLKF